MHPFQPTTWVSTSGTPAAPPLPIEARKAIAFLLLICVPVAPGGQPRAAGPADRIVSYAPGLRIHWADLFVELDGKIVLRAGPLELFACTPHTREHESIVVVSARPLRIFEALGLIGLEPGAPTTYDEASDRWVPARGAPLRIDVVVRADGTEKVWGIHEWMRPATRAAGFTPAGERRDEPGGSPCERLERCDWVFAGSRRFPGDRFAADGEGTVICVVDFDTALIALPEPHTSDNAALWLEADTERIPPIDTPCLLRISSAERGRTRVEVSSNGDLRMEGRPTTADDITERLRAAMTRDPGAHAVLVPENREACDAARALQERLSDRGLKTVLRLPEPSPTTAPSSGPG
ncbi:MAG: YdjY domain-containing protein [Planctomycetota bacterium]